MRLPAPSPLQLVALLCAACTGGSRAAPVDASAPSDAASTPDTDGAEPAAGDGAASPTDDGGRIPPTDTSAPLPAERSDVYARAGVVLGSCWPDDGVNRNTAYLWEAASIAHFWGALVEQADCLARHGGGCAALPACTGFELSLDPAGCVPGCAGDVFSDCYDGGQLSLDCARLGRTCSDGAVCIAPGAASCDQTFRPRCDDAGRPQQCQRGDVLSGRACAGLGLVCSDGACRGEGVPCTDFSGGEIDVSYQGMGCAGDVLSACVGGREHARDCRALGQGFSCHVADGVSFCGLAGECVPAELPNYDQPGTPAVCAQGRLTFCNAGRLDTLDCTSLGFEGCADTGDACGPMVPRADTPD